MVLFGTLWSLTSYEWKLFGILWGLIVDDVMVLFGILWGLIVDGQDAFRDLMGSNRQCYMMMWEFMEWCRRYRCTV